MYENPSNANNVWASLRTFDAYGIQYIDIIMQVSYHAVQFTQVVVYDNMILNTKYMIQDVLVVVHPDILLYQFFLNHVIIKLHLHYSKFFYLFCSYEILFIFHFSFFIFHFSFFIFHFLFFIFWFLFQTFHSSWRKEVMTSAMGTQKWLTLKEQVIEASFLSCRVLSHVD